jgi:hypothetical protein
LASQTTEGHLLRDERRATGKELQNSLLTPCTELYQAVQVSVSFGMNIFGPFTKYKVFSKLYGLTLGK